MIETGGQVPSIGWRPSGACRLRPASARLAGAGACDGGRAHSSWLEGALGGKGSRRGLTLALALGIDLTQGEPPASLHPVVWLGRLIAALERHAPTSDNARLLYGAACVGSVVGGCAACGRLAEMILGRLPMGARMLATAWLLKSTFALQSLVDAAESVRAALEGDDLDAARAALRSLVSRDVTTLSPALLAAAATESVAENAGDSLVAPLLFYVVAGLPGALAYRAVNTFDSMWGYHGDYEYLGKTAARLDDLANLLPARLTGLLVVGVSGLCGHSWRAAWRTMVRDHACTASPNAGWAMSAMAGALGVELEKVGQYRLGSPGKAATPQSIAQAVVLLRLVATLTVTACMLEEVLRHARG
jgi:adenosylcobinamide-phosphate synthase